METINNKDDIGFDLSKAVSCINIYSNSVGIGCTIINAQGKTIYTSFADKEYCGFCRYIHSIQSMRHDCVNAHLYGMYQAERFGGKYIFFCPMGLVHWVSPIWADTSIKGAVLGGPVQMVEPEEFLLEDIFKKNGMDKKCLAEINRYIEKVPLIKPDMVNSLSELLFMVALHISDLRPSKYSDERESQEQQSEIVEYIRYIRTMGGDETSIGEYPLKKEKELLSLISLGDKAGSQKVLNEIFGHIFFSTGGNFEVIKARILELVVLLSRAALEGGADVEQIFGLNYKYLNQIHGFHTVEELTFWLSKIMARFTDCVFNLVDVKHVDVIYRAIDYVKKNYMKKISLEEVASKVYLSPSYFSKIFKEEMKYNFNNYLNYIRIGISKKLLLDETVPLVDISNLAGYEDQSYFSKVFKKLTGVSPGKYRESRGQLKVNSSKELI